MDLQERLYTIEEYLAITRLSANENKRLELVDGMIVEKGKSERMSPADRMNKVIAAIILAFLNVPVLSKNIGYVSGADGGYIWAEGKFVCLMWRISRNNGRKAWWGMRFQSHPI